MFGASVSVKSFRSSRWGVVVVKLLHTADNHLDPKLSYLGAKAMERREDFLRAFRRVVEFALERKPHLFLVAGDLFDSVNPRNPVRTQVIRAFRRLHSEGVRVVVVAGNHDMPRSAEEGMSPLHELEASGYARFLSSPERPEVEHVRVEGLDVAVAGLSFNPAVPEGENPLRYARSRLPVEGDVNIALLHYNFAGVEAPPAWRAPAISREDVPRGYSYVALGHVHSRAVVDLGEAVAAYPGSTERRSFLEEGDGAKGFLWVEVPQGGKPRIEFVETPSRPMRTVSVEVPPTAEDPVKHVLSSLPPPQPDLLLRLVITGLLPLQKVTRYSRAELLKHLEKRFFHVVVDDSGLRCSLDSAQQPRVRAKSPIEAFKEEVAARIASVLLEEDRRVLERALELGVRALEEVGAW